MDLIDMLASKEWQKGDSLLEIGFQPYTIIHTEPLGDGKFKYAVKKLARKEEDIELEMLYLEGASGKRSPLQTVKNCNFKVDGSDILGIDLDGDCVMKKKQIM